MRRFAVVVLASVVCLMALWRASLSGSAGIALSDSVAAAGSAAAPTASVADPGIPAEGVDHTTPPESHAESGQFAVHIRRPAGPPRIELAGLDPQGRGGTVACSTCHSIRQSELDNRTAETLDVFHQGMEFDHGQIGCYACHNPDDADTLRMADQRVIEYSDVMTLCSQCHSPQATAYAHGAHGGMNGHWDLSRGGQVKNNCVDCHDPHVPRFPKMIVGFKPRDRFLQREASHDDQ